MSHVMLDNKVWIVVPSRPIDRLVHDRPAEEGEVDREDLHDQDQNHVVDRNHVVDPDQKPTQNLHQICIYVKNDRWWQLNGKDVSEEKTKTDLIQKFIISEKIMSEKENFLLDLRNIVENINVLGLCEIDSLFNEKLGNPGTPNFGRNSSFPARFPRTF